MRYIYVMDYSVPRIVEIITTSEKEAEEVLFENGFKESQCSWLETDKKIDFEYGNNPEDEQWFICEKTYTDARLDYAIINEGDFMKRKNFDANCIGCYRKATDEEVAQAKKQGKL